MTDKTCCKYDHEWYNVWVDLKCLKTSCSEIHYMHLSALPVFANHAFNYFFSDQYNKHDFKEQKNFCVQDFYIILNLSKNA